MNPLLMLQSDSAVQAAVETVANAEKPENITIWDMAVNGGWIMLVLALLLVLAIYIFIERYITLSAALKGEEDNGDEYESFVNYWMAFIGNSYGLHDATWRGTFGGSIYQGAGSHGCVNMPYNSAAELYSMVSPGTLVLIY